MMRLKTKHPQQRSKGSFDLSILGGGSFGTALASLASRNSHRIGIWVLGAEQAREINDNHTNQSFYPGIRLPSSIQATTNLREAIHGAPVVFMAIPSKSFRQVARKVGNYISGEQILVHVTKGIEMKTFRRMSEILREETCALKIGVISGPTLAKELMKGHPAGAVIASHYDEVVQACQALFEKGPLRLYGRRDVIGAEIAGAFKNIIALVSGAADGMGFGSNTKAMIITHGLSEMIRYGVALGADASTFMGLAGIGDLLATCTSPLSRNFQTGRRFAKGEKLTSILADLHQTVEGIPTTAAVEGQAQAMHLNLPLVNAAYRAIYQKVTIREILTQLMEIPSGREGPHGHI